MAQTDFIIIIAEGEDFIYISSSPITKTVVETPMNTKAGNQLGVNRNSYIIHRL